MRIPYSFIIDKYGNISLDEQKANVVKLSAPPPVAVNGVAIDDSIYTLAQGGTGVQAALTITPQNASNKNVTWTTSNPAVATVNPDGYISPVGPGLCYVTAVTADGGFETTVNVRVSAPVIGVTMNKSAITLTLGGSYMVLSASITPDNASNKAINWSCNNSAVATVDNAGRVTPVGVGNCVVTAATVDGGFTTTCAVEVKTGIPVTGITLDKSELILVPGGASVQLSAVIGPENATNGRSYSVQIL